MRWRIIELGDPGLFDPSRLTGVLAVLRRAPRDVRALADKSFELLKADSRHPLLRLKRVGRHWSVRVGLHYRALGVNVDDGVLWIWIGTHADYDALVG